MDGHKDDVLAVARQVAPDGLDAALLAAGGAAADKGLDAVRQGGRVAFPNGVEPEPRERKGLTLQSYNGMPNPEVLKKLNQLIESGPFQVHIARIFPLAEAAEAHRMLGTHYLGKLALRVD